jgi:hypothetical protein
VSTAIKDLILLISEELTIVAIILSPRMSIFQAEFRISDCSSLNVIRVLSITDSERSSGISKFASITLVYYLFLKFLLMSL